MSITRSFANLITATGPNAVADGTIVNADVNASAAIAASKLTDVGITVAELWRIRDTNFTTSTTSAIFTTPGLAVALTGSAQMTQASGVFTFPSTGYYLIQFLYNVYDDGDVHRQCTGFINSSTDSGSSFGTLAQGNVFMSYHQSSNTHNSGFTQCIFDVTNTSTHKVQFSYYFTNTSLSFYADNLGCTAYFQKLGNT